MAFNATVAAEIARDFAADNNIGLIDAVEIAGDEFEARIAEMAAINEIEFPIFHDSEHINIFCEGDEPPF